MSNNTEPRKFQMENKTYGKCYLIDAICIYASQNKLCTKEDAQQCRWRQINGQYKHNADRKCYYPAHCDKETPDGHCAASKHIKCSYRGNDPLAKED